MSTTLLVDATFMCHRARHTTGSLSYGDMPTGVAFGVLRDVDLLCEQFGANRVLWAFDQGPNLRIKINPDYKANRRKDLTPEEQEELNNFHAQLENIKNNLLPELGYRNIHCYAGYEADDIIARVVKNIGGQEDAVIVTADNDLWQCLCYNVIWYNPITKKVVTWESFCQRWGLQPYQWASVKAIAGCSSDNVAGVRGVGEKTAAKFLRRELTGKKELLISESSDLMFRNLTLVRIPFPSTPNIDMVPDEVTDEKRRLIQQKLGVRSKRASVSNVSKRKRLFDA